MGPRVAAALRRNKLLAGDATNLVAGLVGDVYGVGHFRSVLGLGRRGVRRLDDIFGIFSLDDLNAFGLDRCHELVVDFACVFLRNTLYW